MPKPPIRSIDECIGAQLRGLRKSRDVTQGELAQHLNISFQQVQKYENGQNRIAVATLVEICAFFRVPVTYFFDGLIDDAGMTAEPDPFLTEVRKFLATPDGAEFLKCYLAITEPKARKSVSELVRVLARPKCA